MACHHCGICHIEPSLISALEELRKIVGKPLTVTCGYRCVTHNNETGGTRDSMHIRGKAADITFAGPLSALYVNAESVDAFHGGGIGVYPDEGFIHVDVRDGSARWGRVKGKYVGLAEALKVLTNKESKKGSKK